MINVNLKPCACVTRKGEHLDPCPNSPIPIPCPVPRSVTFSVVLGECAEHPACIVSQHSIAGKTWAESEVTGFEYAHVGDWVPERDRPRELQIEAACRARWALVKALVLGYSAWDYTMSQAVAVPLATITAMLAQRDEVFAALADMVRAEEAAKEAQERCLSAAPYPVRAPAATHNLLRERRPSATHLASYVDFLIASVNTL